MNWNRLYDIVAAKISWALSWFQISRVSWRFRRKAARRYNNPMKAEMSILSTLRKWGYLSLSSKRSANLSIAVSMTSFVCVTIFSIILSVKNKLKESIGVCARLAIPLGPGLFFTMFAVPRWRRKFWFPSVSQLITMVFLASVYLNTRLSWFGKSIYLSSSKTSSRLLNFCFLGRSTGKGSSMVSGSSMASSAPSAFGSISTSSGISSSSSTPPLS